jgi:hypothetical protein
MGNVPDRQTEVRSVNYRAQETPSGKATLDIPEDDTSIASLMEDINLKAGLARRTDAPFLGALPPEILRMILERLDPASFSALSCTCFYLYNQLLLADLCNRWKSVLGDVARKEKDMKEHFLKATYHSSNALSSK